MSNLSADGAQPDAAQGISERKKWPPENDYEVWRRARLAERLGLAHTRQNVWHHLITVVVQAAASNTEALAHTLSTLNLQTYRNIEILVTVARETRPADAKDFASLRGLFVEPALDALDVLSDSATDRLWRGSHLVFATAGTTFDPDAFELLNRMLSPLRGTSPPDLVICDHDRLVAPGASPEPCFLPGWDPDLEDSVCSIAGAALEIAASEMSLGLQVANHGLDGGAAPQFALDGAEDASLLSGDKDATRMWRIVAAVSLVDIGALDLAAGELLRVLDDGAQGVTVIRIARHIQAPWAIRKYASAMINATTVVVFLLILRIDLSGAIALTVQFSRNAHFADTLTMHINSRNSFGIV